MKLSNKRYEEIKSTISDLFCDYNINKCPIDLFELCEKIGIKMHPYSKCSIEQIALFQKLTTDGFSFLNGESAEFHIYYDDFNSSETRIRFTIAHELGHIILEHIESTEETESEADFFARNTLAPLPFLIHLKVNNSNEIANTFNVSSQCACNIERSLLTRVKYIKQELKSYEYELIKVFIGIAN